MSDLRLEDLVVPNPNIEGDYYPVTRVEVLKALGAKREWHCTRLALRKCWPAQNPGFTPKNDGRDHDLCGWRWVVTDAT